jgi:hypothetical protein
MPTFGWMVLSGAIGWVGATYVYSQLSPAFKQRRPLLAAMIVGGIVGVVVISALNLLMNPASH